MMLKEPVSDSVVRRLPRYYRYLSEIWDLLPLKSVRI